VLVSSDRATALLIRVWLEGEQEPGSAFRARVMAVRGPGTARVEDVTLAVAASPREVIAAVGDWLEGFLGDAPDPVDDDM
jgi:hypothetical protein